MNHIEENPFDVDKIAEQEEETEMKEEKEDTDEQKEEESKEDENMDVDKDENTEDKEKVNSSKAWHMKKVLSSKNISFKWYSC